ncbi:ABC transporter-like,P-loop containing nucleoside triphosphate hydrolase,AAA+ ATPase domain,ABC [Cinara cedri]|uniref:ABC transporter-like,P-loop containing nucleoside triphosphate hydrolase,AAA+ ATPase domain,ABC n=1 Tax=Cinara cedri TaxID=506608 RepID=A0A5E4M8U0_9HEMI|nr:ABC transporter-like,P-loop containing nucleoside triphosphate hydrolase,AAA+ ATPase domain,ABC [Cinara cedri]
MFVEQHNSIVNYDVQVTNAYKSYETNNIILNGLSMKVASGSIYGLLGPSGCGKSTLFQCILGKTSLDSGDIELNAQRLNDIGYMPQDLCLDEKLTIKETFEYYGSLYAMRKKKIAKRIDELMIFLKLPDFNSLISNLSGGQSRRVSLAISILHDPKIIFLDEPTVGIDSLIRHEIWMEFSKMVEQHKKTIIITTHYIQEANLANSIGLMRNGVIIEEGSPQHILAKYNTDSLESAFLKLCYNQNKNQVVINNDNGVQVNHDNTPQTEKLTILKDKFNFNRAKALVKKYINLFSRDYVLLMTMFLLPILQSWITCNCIGTEFKDMKIAIKNDEVDFWDFRRSNIDGCILDGENNQKISGVVMSRLELLGYTLNEVENRNDGEMTMSNSSKYIAFIHFPENYTRAFSKYIVDRQNYYYNSQVYVDLNKYNVLFKNKIVFDVKDTLDRITENILSGCSYNSNAVKALGIPLNLVVTSGKDVKTNNNSIVTYLVAIIAFYHSCLFSMSIMLSERMDGILQRSKFAGLKISELVFALFSISSVILITEMIVPLFIIYIWYANPIQVTNGLVGYNILLIFVGWTGFFFGLIVACVSPTKLVGITIVNGFTFSQALLSGGVWPVEAQPPLLKMVSEFLPIRRSGIIMMDITLKGWTLDHPLVIWNVIGMFFYNVILVLVLIGLGKLKKNIWTIK